MNLTSTCWIRLPDIEHSLASAKPKPEIGHGFGLFLCGQFRNNWRTFHASRLSES